MIQRIQSIYLFLVALCMSLALVFSFSTYIINGNDFSFSAFGLILGGKQLIGFPLYPFLISSTLLALFSLFLFKKRKRQLAINKLNYLLIIGVIVLMFVSFNSLEQELIGEILRGDLKEYSYGIGMFLPIASLVFNFLANRAIKSDEKLIDSLDRLR